MKQQFLNDSGLTELIGYIKKYVKDDQDVKPYASLSVFPKTGEQNIIYIDTTTNASYYWDDASKTYKALDVQTWANLTGKPSTFPPSTHTHDDRYYTETEMNTKLAAKANSSHTHKKADITDFPTSMPASDVPAWAKAATKPSYTKAEVGLGSVDNTADKDKSVKYATSAGSATTATTASSANAVAWGNVTGKPSTYPASSHTHDDRYYTEGEINTLLDVKAVNKVLTNEDLNTITTPGFYSASGGNTVTNKPSDIDNFGLIVIHKASGSYYTQILFYDTVSYRRICANGTWGSWTQDKLTDTNTWRGIQNNLTSDSTTDSLSAAQGKALKTLVDGKSALGHKHTKSDITNFPTSMPASDVYSWAKASTKPAYSWSEINNKPSTFTPSSHTHGSGDITSLSADKITGVIGIDHLPAGALERCKIVADDTARFKLTKNDVQNGDTVKVGTDANAKMYFVIDDTKLSSEAGYTIYTAGSATPVPWSGVTGKPSTFTPSSHTHDDRYYTESEMNTKLAGKSDTGHTHDDRYYTESEMNTKLAGKSDTSHSHNLSTMINTLTEGTSAPTDNDYYIAQYAGGGTTTTTYHRRLHSALWSYIKGKADSVYQAKGSYAASSHTHTISQITDISKANVNAATTINSATPTLSTGVEHNPITIKKNANGIFDSTGKHNNSIISALDFAWYNTNWQIGNIRGDSNDSIGFGFAYKSSSDGALSLKSYIDTNGVYHGNISGTATSASTATALTTNAGSTTQPVYFSGGKPVATTYTLGASVPAGAKFTDTNTWRGIQNNLTSDSTSDSLAAAQGKALKALVDGKAAASHTHTIANITGLQTALDGKAASSHSHSYLPLSGGTLTGILNINRGSVDKVSPTSQDIVINVSATDETKKSPGIGFHIATKNYATLKYLSDGSFRFYNSTLESYVPVYASFYGTLSGNASSATNATNATNANYLNIVAGNEIRFNKPSWTGKKGLWFGYKWSDSSAADLIDSYHFGNGNGGYASIKAASFIGNASTATNVAWSGVTGKPSTFTPSSHTHTISNITGLQSALDGKAASSHSHSYLPLSGGTITGTTNFGSAATYINSSAQANLRAVGTNEKATYLAFPGGGGFNTTTSTNTGYLKITLPQSWTSTMMSFRIKLYEYRSNTSCEYVVAGYNYNGDNGKWVNTTAYSLGKNDVKTVSNYTVRFGHDGSKCAIYIGEASTVWNYPQVQVCDFLAGYSNYDYAKWASGWSVGFTTTLGTITQSVSNPNASRIYQVSDVGNGANTTFAYSKAGMAYADYTWLAAWNGNELRAVNKTQFAQASHSHTISNISDIGNASVKYATSAGSANAVTWANVSGKPSTFAPSTHTHGQYYDSGISRTANTVLAAPNGSAGSATFRKLVEADIPTLSKSKVGLGNVDNTADSAKSVKYATSAGSASSATTAGSCTGNAATATKLATARTISLTGSVTGSGSFDGSGNLSIATSTNHSHNYAGSSSAGGSANSAVKLATARNIALSGLSSGSANFDGSGNITINNWGYGCKKYVTTNAITAPYFRIAYYENATTYLDASMIFVIDSGYNGGGFGIVKVAFRNNNTATANQSNCELKWLVRQGFAADQLFIKGNAPAGGVQYADLYFKATGTYQAVTVTVLSSGGRGTQARTWTFEEGSSRAAADIRAYSYTTNGSDGGTTYSAATATTASSASSVAWSNVSGKPSTFTPSSHTHNYAGSASAGGSATSAVKLDSSAGSATQPIYFSSGKPVACSYTIATSVPSGAKFTDTNTWRPLGTTGDTACAGNDSRLSNARPASDVYSWAKASSKPSYSWSEIGSKPSTFTPSSHSHSYIAASMSSSTVPAKATDGRVEFYYNVNHGLANNMPSTNNANAIISLSRHSGDYSSQLGFSSDGNIYYREGVGTTAWKTILTSSNYTSYTVTKSGSGASGTWGINVTGSAGSVAWGNVSGRPSSMPASDVYSWAKASSKPSYSWSEISGRPSSLPASDVYAWAKASSKPSYSWSEIGGKPSTFAPASGSNDYVRVYNSSNVNGSTSVTFNDLAKQHYAMGMINAATDNPYGAAKWAHGISLAWTNGTNTSWVSQIALGVSDGTGMWYRTNQGTIIGKAWTRVIDSSNIGSQSVKYATSAGSANSVAWGNVSGKPSTFTPSSHTHSYAGSSSAGGSANSAVKLDTATAGSATQPVYFTGGKPAACSYTLGKSVPSNAVFTDTNTWRPVVNNLVSTATDQSLSAAQGKTLKDKLDKLTPIGYIFVWSNYKSDGTAISGAPDLSTAEKVAAHFGGGTWARIDGKFLYGYTGTGDYTLGKTGGATTVSLSTANLPSHSHSIPALSGSAASAGAHTHTLKYFTDNAVGGKSARVAGNGKETTGSPVVNSAGAHTHTVTTKAGTSGSNGSGTAHNNMPPFMAVYIWQRVA